MTTPAIPDWIAVDWGTTQLRAFAMQGATALSRLRSQDGMSKLAPADFEGALIALIAPWLEKNRGPVVACGMLGARQGWIEAPYRTVPCVPLAATMTLAPSATGLSVHVIPGLSQASPPDVMRGEETQIAGFLQLNPGWDGVLCLPGTHTKWVHLSAGEVVSFQTFMTGELFDLIGSTSVLRHAMATDGWVDSAFLEAAEEALARPERLAARLFSLRAASLLQGTGAAETRARLSGLLIGAELAASRPYWLGQNLAILKSGAQARAYHAALAIQAAPAMLVDGERATLAGLTAAWRLLKGKP